MADAQFVAIQERFDDLGEQSPGSVLGEVALVDDPVEEFTSSADLEDQIDVSLVLVGLEQLDDVWMVLNKSVSKFDQNKFSKGVGSSGR